MTAIFETFVLPGLAVLRPVSAVSACIAALRGWRPAFLWIALFMLLVIAQGLLVHLTIRAEEALRQEHADQVAATIGVELRQRMSDEAHELAGWSGHPPALRERFGESVATLFERRELIHVERRDAAMATIGSVDSPYQGPLFRLSRRDEFDHYAQAACAAARRSGEPGFSPSYFVPAASSVSGELVDICVTDMPHGEAPGFLVGTLSLNLLLENAAVPRVGPDYELSFVTTDKERIARSGSWRGAGVFTSIRLVSLPDLILQLRVDSTEGRPRLIPNLATALVVGLSLLLFAVVIALARDVRKRAHTESALAEALAMRRAIEVSSITGQMATDPFGRVTYANPAFCRLIGYSVTELIGAHESIFTTDGTPLEVPLDPGVASHGGNREVNDAVYRTALGEALHVRLYESVLVDGGGKRSGSLCTVVDLTAQRRLDETERRQRERLHATARLATMGEIASLLSHELSQPLSAIASYASGSINLLDDHDPGADGRGMLRQATQGIAEQAERAGRIIQSVQDFVRCRTRSHEPVTADRLLESLAPLMRLQARGNGTTIAFLVESPAPSVRCDRTMVEQVLLNLTRNAVQAMDDIAEAADRKLVLRVCHASHGRVRFSVIDRGPGIPEFAVARLFTPFFTTRRDGMGLGLSLCRTVIEQHGGTLEFENLVDGDAVVGAAFHFTLAAAGRAHGSGAARSSIRS